MDIRDYMDTIVQPDGMYKTFLAVVSPRQLLTEYSWIDESTVASFKPTEYKTVSETHTKYVNKQTDNVAISKFVEWDQKQPVTAMDILNGTKDLKEEQQKMLRENLILPSFVRRIYFTQYKPTCVRCYDPLSPIFVVLNGAPMSPSQTTTFCSFVGTYYNVLSFDCVSRTYNPKLFGDKSYTEKEKSRLLFYNYDFRSSEYAQDVQAMANVIIEQLVRLTGNIKDIGKRTIVIISTLYTTHMASVLSGSTILRKYKNNVTCVYMSNAVLPFKKEAKTVAQMVDTFCDSTESIREYGTNLIPSVKAFVSETISLDSSERENKQMSLEDINLFTSNENVNAIEGNEEPQSSTLQVQPTVNSKLVEQIFGTNFIEDTEKYLSAAGTPEKACYMVQLCRNIPLFERIFIDIALQHTNVFHLTQNCAKILDDKEELPDVQKTLVNQYYDPGYTRTKFISFDTNPPNFETDAMLYYAHFMNHINFVPINLGYAQMNTKPLHTLMTILQYLDQANQTKILHKFIEVTSFELSANSHVTTHTHKY